MERREPESKGARLGRYVLDDWLASGGMADVYRARAHGAAGVVKELAIKRVASQILDSERALERFVAEARLSMQLSHANIVSVFDFGRAEDGYYLAMEWIDGIDLASFLGRVGDPSPLPLAVVAHVGGEIARALQHAHEQPGGPIVHRDVKPSNVLVSRAGDVKLGDFGIAITEGDARTIAGTRGYMAPEQARGEPVTARADLYGLGKILLELAVGFRVDDADVAHALALIEVELRAIVEPLLATDPEARTPTAQRAASALERLSSIAIARGDEAPRDALVALVARACARRAPSSGSSPRVGRVESFALTATAQAIRFGSDALTRDDAPQTEASADAASDAPDRAPTVSRRPRPRDRAHTRRLAVFAPTAVAALAVIALALGREPSAPNQAEAPPQPTSTHPTDPTPVPVNVNGPEPEPVNAPATVRATVPVPVNANVNANAPEPARVPVPVNVIAPEPQPEPARVPVNANANANANANMNTNTRASAPDPASPPLPNPSGVLNIAARPWANAYVDGRSVGVTPVLGLSVSAGRHTVRLENDALGVARTVNVEVPADGRRNLSVDLE